MAKIQYFTCKVMNVKTGETGKGNPYRRFGLKIQGGATVTDNKGKETEWLNYFKVVTEKTLPYYRQDCTAMGVTNDTEEGFAADGRLCTIKYGPGTNPKRPGEMDVLGVLPLNKSKATPAAVLEGVPDVEF